MNNNVSCKPIELFKCFHLEQMFPADIFERQEQIFKSKEVAKSSKKSSLKSQIPNLNLLLLIYFPTK